MKICIFSARRRFFLKPIPRRNVHLTPDDRLDSLLFRRLVKLDRPVKIPVIRQRQRGLTQLLRPGRQFRHTTRPVQQGVFRMTVQMNKGVRHDQ